MLITCGAYSCAPLCATSDWLACSSCGCGGTLPFCAFTPLQVARGYSVMANGGFLVNPFFISKIENDQGGVLFEERPKIACPQCDLPA